ADRENVPMGADAIHHLAVIVGRERALDVALEPEAAAEVGLLHEVNLTERPARRVGGHHALHHEDILERCRTHAVRHGRGRQETVSVSSGTASNEASSPTRPAAVTS